MQLRLTDLTPRQREDGVGSVFGVEGCGQRATYVYEMHHTWIMNSDEHPAEEKRTPSAEEKAKSAWGDDPAP
jgi:hypothetical protein